MSVKSTVYKLGKYSEITYMLMYLKGHEDCATQNWLKRKTKY
jgi:hypothetical protein